MSDSCYGNESKNVMEEGNVASFSGNMDFQAVQPSQGSGSSSPIEVTEDNRETRLVLYCPKGNDTEEEVQPIQSQPPSYKTPYPSIDHFTVQCASCLKWRRIPSLQKYEEIREQVLKHHFFCETAREWEPDMSCDVPEDISQYKTCLWAIDKPGIARPPTGWQRLMRLRRLGGTRFADVYYLTPAGKKLRSSVEVQKYLNDHPQYGEGVELSQFSFQIPTPLHENFVKKRPADTPVATEGNPVESPDDHIALQLGETAEPGIYSSHDRPSKMSRTSELSNFGSDDDLADR